MGIGSAMGIGTSVLGAVTSFMGASEQADAAGQAADAQWANVQLQRDLMDWQMQQYNRNWETYAPYRTLGTQVAAPGLAAMLGYRVRQKPAGTSGLASNMQEIGPYQIPAGSELLKSGGGTTKEGEIDPETGQIILNPWWGPQPPGSPTPNSGGPTPSNPSTGKEPLPLDEQYYEQGPAYDITTDPQYQLMEQSLTRKLGRAYAGRQLKADDKAKLFGDLQLSAYQNRWNQLSGLAGLGSTGTMSPSVVSGAGVGQAYSNYANSLMQYGQAQGMLYTAPFQALNSGLGNYMMWNNINGGGGW